VPTKHVDEEKKNAQKHTFNLIIMSSLTLLGTHYLLDDRVNLVAEFLAEHLTQHNIEIEAKIGRFEFTDNKPYFQHISWLNHSVTPFRFNSSLNHLTFTSLIDNCRKQKLNCNFAQTQDTIYRTKLKASKLRQTCDQEGNILATVLKTRVKDLNILVNPETGLGFRLSANIEEPLDSIPENSKLVYMRNKSRHEFEFQYLRLDLTEVQANQHRSFEVELEISDLEFVRKHVEGYVNGGDTSSLLGVANKLWQNVLAVAFHRPRAPIPEAEEPQAFKTQRENKYAQHWGGVKPIIGDYLYEIAGEAKDEFTF